MAALVRDGGADLGVRFDGRFEVGVRFEGFGAGVQQQTERAAGARHAPGLDGGAPRGDSGRPTSGPATSSSRESPAGFRAKLSAQPTEIERVANAALGSLFPVLDRPRAVHYPTLGLGFVSGEPRAGASLAAALIAAREALVGRERGAARRAAPSCAAPPASGERPPRRCR